VLGGDAGVNGNENRLAHERNQIFAGEGVFIILPDWRNKGFGAAALAAMEQVLRQPNIGQVTLNVFAHNVTAARLYSKNGYTPVSIRMRKNLKSSSLRQRR
jgi:RimJ/RimL family protein N-acetyltransferase